MVWSSSGRSVTGASGPAEAGCCSPSTTSKSTSTPAAWHPTPCRRPPGSRTPGSLLCRLLEVAGYLVSVVVVLIDHLDRLVPEQRRDDGDGQPVGQRRCSVGVPQAVGRDAGQFGVLLPQPLEPAADAVAGPGAAD